MKISFSHKGNFSKTERFLKKIGSIQVYNSLRAGAEKGLAALRSATPVDSSETAASWGYVIKRSKTAASITWTNSNKTPTGVPIVILLQYGHGTGTGGYVQGRDFINPALAPIFDEIAESIWKAIKSA